MRIRRGIVALGSNAQATPPASNPTPSYISGLDDYEVLKLDTVTATNGNSTLLDATPSAWVSGDPAGNANSGNAPHVTVPWCGGCGDSEGNRIIVRGGGHDDGANNGTYIVDFSGDTQWAGCSLEDGPSDLADVPSRDTGLSLSSYNDGRAAAVHSYDGQVYDPSSQKHFLCGGSTTYSGNLVGATWTYEESGGTWTEQSDPPFAAPSGRVMSAAIDTTEQKILVTQQNSQFCAIFDIVNETWSSSIDLGSAVADTSTYHVSACSETSSEVVTMQSSGFKVITVDWDLETASMQTLTVSGWSGEGAAVLLWDPTDDSYWAFGGTAENDHDTLYHITGSGTSRTATSHTLTDTNITVPSGNNGAFNRAVLLSDYRAIGYLSGSRDEPYIIKLPSGS